MKTTKQSLSLVSILMASLCALAQSGTWSGNSTGNWSDSANWVGGTIASGMDATATFNLTNSYTVTLDSSYTIGTLRLTASSGQNFTLNGSGSPTLTFATSSGTPQMLLNTYFGKVYSFGQSGALNFSGNQGLSVDAGTGLNTLRLYSGVTWTGFSGTLTLIEGYIDPQAANVMPASSDLVVGTGSVVSGLGMFGGRDQTIGALNGNSLAYVYNNSTTTYSTLTLGTGGGGGTFVGTIGKNNGDGSTTFRSDINLTKSGAGTERLSGVNYHGGTTTVNGGTLLVNGQHIATVTTTGNAAAATGQGGKYQVNNGGTLGGTGTIKPFDTLGGTVMININNGGVLAPGDGGIGTLTLDGSASSASLLILNGGATLSYELGAGNTSDALKLLNAQNNEVIFNNNIINFTDLTAGSLGSGQYLLFQSDLASGNTYNGLTEDGSGYITGGLTAAGLSGYGTSLQQVGQDIYLNIAAVPEPTTLGLLGLSGLMLGFAARRRR
jgi:autotransporter-associated beta strand protein